MLILLLLSFLATFTLAAKCPTDVKFNGGVKNFAPWHADSSQKCSFSLSQPNVFESVEITIVNIGPNDVVTISSGNGSIQLTNRKIFQETFSVYKTYHIATSTGANTQMVLEYNAVELAVEILPVGRTVQIAEPTRSFVLHMDEFLTNTAITFSIADLSEQLVIQKAEIANDPADVLQWSNVLIYNGKDAAGSIFDLIGDTGMYTSTRNYVTLYFTEPINFKGAILITTSLNVKPFVSHGVVYADPSQPSQTISIGNGNLGKSYVTVIGNRDGSTPITVRSASPSTISVIPKGPDRIHDILVPLTQIPLSMPGNIWTFYSNQGSGVVKFSAGA